MGAACRPARICSQGFSKPTHRCRRRGGDGPEALLGFVPDPLREPLECLVDVERVLVRLRRPLSDVAPLLAVRIVLTGAGSCGLLFLWWWRNVFRCG